MIALLVASGFSLTFTLLLTPLFIRLFKRLGWGQFVRHDGPQTHHAKRGTPTMGGIVFVVGSVLGYAVGHAVAGEPWTTAGFLAFGMMAGVGLVGFIDDLLSTRRQRSPGLGSWSKIAGQAVVATTFAILALNFADEHGTTPASTSISALRDIGWLDLFTFGPIVGIILFALWVNLVTVSASNGVNLANGLDGLATGASIVAFSAYIFIGFWQSNQSCPSVDEQLRYKCYEARDPLDLAVVAATIAGSLIGFLWWNTSPARIVMGSTGALALGGALAALAILSRTELLLILLGGLFFVVTGSVIVQRAYFTLTHGKRMLLMSPLQHHFELKGWPEVTVVVRFWLIGALFAAAGVGLFYLEWVGR